jgi:hypothetical protein
MFEGLMTAYRWWMMVAVAAVVMGILIETGASMSEEVKGWRAWAVVCGGLLVTAGVAAEGVIDWNRGNADAIHRLLEEADAGNTRNQIQLLEFKLVLAETRRAPR